MTPDEIARDIGRYAIETAQQAWPESNGPLLKIVAEVITEALTRYGNQCRAEGAEAMREAAANRLRSYEPPLSGGIILDIRALPLPSVPTEREWIVAWLRDRDFDYGNVADIAQAIEAGDHMKDEDGVDTDYDPGRDM